MAASPIPSTFVPIEEYLRTDYRPDMEYVDGELRLKDGKLTEDLLVQWAHSRMQVILGSIFEQHRREWGILPGVEARTRVAAARVRLPDVVVVRTAPQTDTITEAPLIAIEIVSPDDRFRELTTRMTDLARMGVANLWIVDPQQRVAWEYRVGAWTEVDNLAVPDTPIVVDVRALFAQLDE